MSMSWPIVNCGYEDPEGYIDPDVYNAARDLWPNAGRLAETALGDETAGWQLMMKAAASVTKRRVRKGASIENLKAYLFRVYEKLVWKEWKRLHSVEQYEDERLVAFIATFAAAEDDSAESVERRILFDQLTRLMDDWTREVFDYLVFGHSFEEIALHHGMKANVVRSQYHKRIRRLALIVEKSAAAARDVSPSDFTPP